MLHFLGVDSSCCSASFSPPAARGELAYWSRVFLWQTSPHGCYAGCYAVLLEHVERGGGGATGAVRSCSARTHAHTHRHTRRHTHKPVEDETANTQENIWAVRTSPHRLRHAPHIHTRTLTHMQTHTFPSCWFGWGHVWRGCLQDLDCPMHCDRKGLKLNYNFFFFKKTIKKKKK